MKSIKIIAVLLTLTFAAAAQNTKPVTPPKVEAIAQPAKDTVVQILISREDYEVMRNTIDLHIDSKTESKSFLEWIDKKAKLALVDKPKPAK